jgi:hypothetical protein
MKAFTAGGYRFEPAGDAYKATFVGFSIRIEKLTTPTDKRTRAMSRAWVAVLEDRDGRRDLRGENHCVRPRKRPEDIAALAIEHWNAEIAESERRRDHAAECDRANRAYFAERGLRY